MNEYMHHLRGTSLPDTFASKAAAVSDDTADAAVGNVTGSNAVNVFLGLGLPFVIASAYWQFQDFDEEVNKPHPPSVGRSIGQSVGRSVGRSV